MLHQNNQPDSSPSAGHYSSPSQSVGQSNSQRPARVPLGYQDLRQRLPGTSKMAHNQDEFVRKQQEMLRRLRVAHSMAAFHQRSLWDFAIEIREFSSIGSHVMRELICNGWVEHQREMPGNQANTRAFIPEPKMVLSERSCFVITPLGLQKLENWATTPAPGMNGSNGSHQAGSVISMLQPVWDTEKRELRLGPHLVKRFKWPAINQEAILRVFQEENWPRRIDDPLTPDPDICPKRRLHDTIKCLNRRRINKYIKFRGDGTGQGVLLEIILPSSEDASDGLKTDVC